MAVVSPSNISTPAELSALAADMRQALSRHYFLLLTPAVGVAALWAGLKQFGMVEPLTGLPVAVLGPAAFILAVVLAVAAPLLIRTRFVTRVAGEQHVQPEPFLAFEKLLLSVSLPSAWAAAAAYVLEVNLFHFAGAMLAALYAAYFYYPSTERVVHEMRLFRVGRVKLGDGAGYATGGKA